MSRYKMNGWFNDGHRHSLAARGISTAARRSYSAKRTGFASVYRTPTPSSNAFSEAMRQSANTMLGKSTPVGSEKNALSRSVSESWSDWFWGKQKGAMPPQELLVGGAADGIPNSEFEPAELTEGELVEMEHTNNPMVADEIAKDHLYETGSRDDKNLIHSEYYPKLKELENTLKMKSSRPTPAMTPVEPVKEVIK